MENGKKTAGFPYVAVILVPPFARWSWIIESILMEDVRIAIHGKIRDNSGACLVSYQFTVKPEDQTRPDDDNLQSSQLGRRFPSQV
jgi:hypothetical protein